MAVMVLRSDLWPSDADAEAETDAEAEADVFHLMVASVLRGRTGLWTRKLRVLSQGSFSEVEGSACTSRTHVCALLQPFCSLTDQLCEAYVIVGNI